MKNEPEVKPSAESPSVQTMPAAAHDNGHLAHFLDPVRYRHLQMVAKDFAASEIVPKRYQGKPCDCLIALELAARLGMHPLMVMQNVYTVHGTPGMQGQFVIALLNSSGVFAAPLEWEYDGDGDSRSCTCRATRKKDGKPVELKMSIAIARAEGWYGQNPKWKNIPDQMLAYRSASWLARLHFPEVLMGLQTVEEIADVIDITPMEGTQASNKEEAAAALQAAAKGKPKKDDPKPGTMPPPATDPATHTCANDPDMKVPASTCRTCNDFPTCTAPHPEV